LNEDFKDLISKFYDDEKMFKNHEFWEDQIESFEEEEGDKTYERIEYISFEDYFSDINNLIKINEKDGLKKVNRYMNDFFKSFCGGPVVTGCYSYEERLKRKESITEVISKEEYERFKGYLEEYEEIF